jgi:hypothetical protein
VSNNRQDRYASIKKKCCVDRAGELDLNFAWGSYQLFLASTGSKQFCALVYITFGFHKMRGIYWLAAKTVQLLKKDSAP